jgi:hypothetical protein
MTMNRIGMSGAIAFAMASLQFFALPALAQTKRDLAGLSVSTRAAFLPHEESAVDLTWVRINDLVSQGPAHELFEILKSFVPRDENAIGAERYNLIIDERIVMSADSWPEQGRQRLSATFDEMARFVATHSDAEQHYVVIENDSLVKELIPAMKKLGYRVETGPAWQNGESVSGRFVKCSNMIVSMSSKSHCRISLRNSK